MLNSKQYDVLMVLFYYILNFTHNTENGDEIQIFIQDVICNSLLLLILQRQSSQ